MTDVPDPLRGSGDRSAWIRDLETTHGTGVTPKRDLAIVAGEGAYLHDAEGQALARSLRNLIDTETALQGGADHLVSEALYLSDPDGNGIEIYRDRPRSDWKYENGDLKMGTEPLDYQEILSEVGGEHGGWTGLEAGTRLGHMHLHVSNLAEAAEFYEKVVGFDFLLSYMGSASFL